MISGREQYNKWAKGFGKRPKNDMLKEGIQNHFEAAFDDDRKKTFFI